MKRLDQITGIVLFVASVWYVFEALKMPLHAGKSPGAGWLPLLLGTLMAFLAALLFVAASRRAASADSTVTWPTGEGLVNNVAILVGLVLAVLILETAGYLASTFVFLLAMFLILGKYSLKFALPFALFTSVVLYWVFNVWLDIPLPSGFIDFI